jgi:RNA polymerase sigma factor (sigma-70 family)
MKQAGKNNVTAIFTALQQKLLTFIANRVSSEEDAEDLLQDVFLRFLQTEENVSIEKISAWLYKVARNRIIDYWRKKRETNIPAPSDDEDDETAIKEITDILIEKDANPEQEYLRNFIWEEIENAMDELPKEQREVFEQTELENKSYQELALDSKVSIKTLLSRKHYAVLFLRKRLKKIYEMVLYTDKY